MGIVSKEKWPYQSADSWKASAARCSEMKKMDVKDHTRKTQPKAKSATCMSALRITAILPERRQDGTDRELKWER